MRNNNSELIASGSSVNFNWPPERHNCCFLPASKLHQQQTQSMRFVFAFAPFFFFFLLHATLKPLFGFLQILSFSLPAASLYFQDRNSQTDQEVRLHFLFVMFPSPPADHCLRLAGSERQQDSGVALVCG